MDDKLNTEHINGESVRSASNAASFKRKRSCPINVQTTAEDIDRIVSEYGLADKDFLSAVLEFRKKGVSISGSLFASVYTSVYSACLKKARTHDKTECSDDSHGKQSEKTPSRFHGIEAVVFSAMMKLLSLSLSVRRAASSAFEKVRRTVQAVSRNFDDPKATSRAVRKTLVTVANVALPAILALTLFGTVKTTLERGVSVEVFLNGQSIGYVSDTYSVEKVKKTVEEDISEILGVSYKFEGDIDYRVSFGEDAEFVGEDQIYSKMYGISSADISYVYAMYLDGALVGANAEKELLEQALSAVEQKLSEKYGSSVEIVNKVEVEKCWVSNRHIVTLEEMINNLCKPELDEIDIGTVELSPTLMGVTSDPANTTKELMLLELPNRIRYSFSNTYYIPIDEYSYGEEEILSFRTSDTETYTETVPYKTVYEYSDDLYEGFTSVKTKGALGKRSVTALVNYIDGEETERQILSTEIINEAVDKVVVIGTKERPSTDPTGTFMRPITGKISCPWGWRTLFGEKDFHYGLDFKANVGTTVYASDGGTVVYAGPRGNYGIYIKIQHGTKYETVYAHLSSVLVKVGDKVFKGQPIAKSGNTGMSTGPHLHFEVIVNGVKKNPAAYIEDLNSK